MLTGGHHLSLPLSPPRAWKYSMKFLSCPLLIMIFHLECLHQPYLFFQAQFRCHLYQEAFLTPPYQDVYLFPLCSPFILIPFLSWLITSYFVGGNGEAWVSPPLDSKILKDQYKTLIISLRKGIRSFSCIPPRGGCHLPTWKGMNKDPVLF